METCLIRGVEVPIKIYEGERYFPLRMILEKVLLREKSFNRDKYGKYLKQFEINFGDNTGGLQLSNFISEEGLRLYVSNSKVGKLDTTQLTAMNELLGFLSMPLVGDGERFKKTLTKQDKDNYSVLARDMVDDYISNNNKHIFQKCSKCYNYYPYNSDFFRTIDIGQESERLNLICKECLDGRFSSNDLYLIYYNYGPEAYVKYKEVDVIYIYNNYIENNLTKIPYQIQNKMAYLDICKYLFENGKLDIHEITKSNLINTFRLDGLTSFMDIYDVYDYLFEEDCEMYPWRYKGYKRRNASEESNLAVFQNYLKDQEIIIEDVLNFDYGKCITDCGITNCRDVLLFAVKYNDYKYPGYMYKTWGINYYKDIENRKFDLKYMIENDFKISNVYKIPLYVTKYEIGKKSRSMLRVLTNYYKNSLFDWVNDAYPDIFEHSDFNANKSLNEFDSDEEFNVDQLLRSEFDNIIYNRNNTDNTVKFGRYAPDWIIFTEKGCCFVEYFGMYDEENDHERFVRYNETKERKMAMYDSMSNYMSMYLYKEDYENDMAGIKDKIGKFKQTI